jgi:hypothetical protein
MGILRNLIYPTIGCHQLQKKKINKGSKEKLVGHKDQPSEEEPTNVIVEIPRSVGVPPPTENGIIRNLIYLTRPEKSLQFN